jgi:pimeloyl-ACP methyl ester carboxylesterase
MTFDGFECGPDDGELVLLLHGFPQTATAWLEVAGHLAAAGYHVVAPNQRGYSSGARPPDVSAYRLQHLVADVLELIRCFGHERAHVVGHDWGGMVAWAVAAGHPSHVETLTVVSTPHPRALRGSLPRSLQALRSSYILFFATPLISERLLAARSGAVLERVLTRSGLPKDAAARYAAALRTPDAMRAALSWYRASVRQPGALASVGEIAVPTTFIWGAKDPALGASAARATGKHVAGPYRFEILEDAGHWLPETHPEAVAAAITERAGFAAALSS